MKLTLIAAMANGRLIGRSDTNGLPWPKLAADIAHFKALTQALTQGRYVVMGRRTWESIPAKFRPLSDRTNIVISSSKVNEANVFTFNSLDLALRCIDDLVDAETPVYVIGGAQLYEEAITHASAMVLTRIQADFEGDVRFPFWHLEHWNRERLEVFQSQDPNDFEYHVEHWKRIPITRVPHHHV